MLFLHNSVIVSHGKLKSSNCVVDNRFVLKITDYGLSSLRSDGQSGGDAHAYYARESASRDRKSRVSQLTATPPPSLLWLRPQRGCGWLLNCCGWRPRPLEEARKETCTALASSSRRWRCAGERSTWRETGSAPKVGQEAGLMLATPPSFAGVSSRVPVVPCAEIVDRVVLGEWPCLRPTVDPLAHSPELGQVMQRCWAEEPTERPDFSHIRLLLRKHNR